jgi:hypothetical protein
MKPIKSHTWRLRVAAFGMACCAVLCLPQASQADNYTNISSVGAGANWNGNYWYDSITGAGPSGPPTPGSTYELVYNGKTVGNGGDTRTRNYVPANTAADPATVQTFPGDSLQLDYNTDFRMKGPGNSLNFPGPGGGLPGLILNGGMINIGDDGHFPITGIISAVATSYLAPGTSGSTGLSANQRSVDIQAQLIGSANLVLIQGIATNVALMQGFLAAPQTISGANNTFSGQWFIKSGWLAGTAPGSLGTNNITVDPNYTVDPGLGFSAASGPALFDVDYDINSAGTLILTNGGQFSLHRNCCFVAVIINGTPLSAGTHHYADLATAYPANIVGGGPGTITVQPYGTPPVIPPNPPVGTVGLNWLHTDVGGPTLPGSVTANADGTETIVGGGSDIYGTGDQAHYYYAWGSGSTWDAIVQVKSFTGPDYWSKCMLMVRASDPKAGPQAGDPFISMMACQIDYMGNLVTGEVGGGARNCLVEQFRTAANGNADWKQVGTDPFAIYPGSWLKIHRAGSVFTLYYAKTLGTPTTWTQYVSIDTSQSTFVGQDNGTTFGTPFPDIVSVGVMVTAHNNADTTGGIATIGNLSATFPAVQAPTVLGATVQVQSVTGAVGNEAYFSFATTNNAVPSGLVTWPGAITYQWYKNGSLVAGATSTDYSFQIAASDANVPVYCQATVLPPYNTTIHTFNSAIGTVTLTPGNYPMIWTGINLGSPAVAGSTTPNGDGTLTLIGGGGDYWNNSDQGYLYYAWATGQHWDAVVQIQGFVGPAAWSKCELMVRPSLSAVGPQANDPFIGLMATPAGGQNMIGSQYRATRSGGCGSGPNGPAPSYPSQWFKMHRNGSVFSLYYGTDGVNWTLYGNLDTSTSTYGGSAYPDLVAVGISVSANNNSVLAGGATATIANLGATFSAVEPPAVIGAATQPPPSLSKPIGCEASLTFVATNNANPPVVNWPGFVNYQWYKNGSLLAGATSTSHTWLLDGSDAGAQYSCQATVLPPFNVTVSSLTSSTATITLVPGIYYTNGLKVEMFTGATDRTAVEQGNAAPATWIGVMPNFDNPGGYGNDYVSRVSGWFIPPATDYYVFFVASDDDSDLYLSTDATLEHKQLIAQETGWSGTEQWLNGGAQARSDTWSPDAGVTVPWSNGIPLIAGQLYYIENVHHQGGGGDNFGVTYQTTNDVAAGTLQNGTPSWLQAASNNIVLVTYAPTTLAWTLQPTNTTVSQGQPVTFYAQAASGSEFALNYQWLRGVTPIPGATGTSYRIAATIPADDQAQFRLVATTAENELSSTSAVATLTVKSAIWEAGFAKMDFWGVLDGTGPGDIRAAVEGGTAPAPNVTLAVPRFEAGVNNENGSQYVNRVSGFFIPPATGDYVFFTCSDDPCDLYISNDDQATHKYMIAQETAYASVWEWLGDTGVDDNPTANPPTTAPASTTQKRSDQWVDATGNTPWLAGIHLTNGLHYYMEVVHYENGGGDHVEVTYKQLADADPANYSDSKLLGNLIGLYVPRITYVSFAQQPANATPPVGGLATFTVQAGPTDSQIAIGTTGRMAPWTNNFVRYQWQRNGVNIPGATGSSFSFGPVSPLDSGAAFTCAIRALGYADNSLTPIWSNSTPASVTVSGNVVYEPGFALHGFWGLNPGRAAIENNIAGSPDWIMASPAFSVGDTGAEIADNFCDELTGFFIPPGPAGVVRSWVFFCNADDDTDLFLSTDSSSFNRRLIALQPGAAGGALQWTTGGAQARSDTFVDPATSQTLYAAGIPLTNGVPYFMQMVHHQGGGNTYSCVTAKLIGDLDPVNGTPSDIRGSEVSCFVPKCTFVTVTNNPLPVTTNAYASATFTAGGKTDSTLPVGSEGDWTTSFNNFLVFQWYVNGTPVAGATSAAFTIPEVLPNYTNVFCTMRALGYVDGSGNPLWATSLAAAINVITGAPPQLLYAALYTNNTGGIPLSYLSLNFSGRMDPVALSQLGNYVLVGGAIVPGGITVNSNRTGGEYRNVILTVTGTPTSVRVNNAGALGGGPALVVNTAAVNQVALTDADIGNPGSSGPPVVPPDPTIRGEMYPTGPNAFTIECEGSDIWANADGFNFAYEMKTGDFDVVVRQKATTHTSNWAKAGLMVRETLDPASRNWNIVNDPASADNIQAPDGSGTGADAVECNARVDTTGGSGAWSGGVVSTVPAYPDAWMRLTRVGTLLSAYWATNTPPTWTLAATNDPTVVSAQGALPDLVYVGVCCTAHNNDPVGTPASQLLYMAYMDFDNYNSSYVPQAIIINTPQVDVVHNTVTITWTPAVGTLYASPAIAGPNVDWLSVGTGGSVTLPMTPAPRFFKVAP